MVLIIIPLVYKLVYNHPFQKPFGFINLYLFRNHSVTFISAFPADFHMQGLEEITPAGLVFYVRNYTNWDLVGSKMRGEEPVPMEKVVDFGYRVILNII